MTSRVPRVQLGFAWVVGREEFATRAEAEEHRRHLLNAEWVADLLEAMGRDDFETINARDLVDLLDRGVIVAGDLDGLEDG